MYKQSKKLRKLINKLIFIANTPEDTISIYANLQSEVDIKKDNLFKPEYVLIKDNQNSLTFEFFGHRTNKNTYIPIEVNKWKDNHVKSFLNNEIDTNDFKQLIVEIELLINKLSNPLVS